MARRPGEVRDAIIDYLSAKGGEARPNEIHRALEQRFGEPVPSSSVRSYLRLNAGRRFQQTGGGNYRLL
jgi:hypothetical protein